MDCSDYQVFIEFAGQLRLPGEDEKVAEPTSLDGTRLLPSLQDKRWELTTSEDQESDGIGTSQQLKIKRRASVSRF